MRFASYAQIAFAMLTISVSTASAGISDVVGDVGPAPADNLSALTDITAPLIDETHPPRLTLDAPMTNESFEQLPPLDNPVPPTAVSAPLPAA